MIDESRGFEAGEEEETEPYCESEYVDLSCLREERWVEAREELGLPQDVDPGLLCRAFCHPSFSREAGLPPEDSNQRLEFLGDAVLDLIFVEHLYKNHPTCPEGNLTKMKAAAARAHTLATVARELDLGHYLLLGHGEQGTGGRRKRSVLADCMESVIGAVYLSVGLAATAEFVMDRFAVVLKEIEAQENTFDYKTTLQELVQRYARQTPTYGTIDTLGPPHMRTFVVSVSFGDRQIGVGEGSSKQAAQQAAAKTALETQEKWLPDIAK